ncbi:hypothetical protein [Bacillus alkalicellulosilyticus]|uniref:hypothetical protein n=1 Tax=Alkalihalobacterium alkalicellulosilyticum TaxID=1912214 RepID=UPI0009982E1C|nr:hypothetical protein [Bacillus alkalicellulosilyticus]
METKREQEKISRRSFLKKAGATFLVLSWGGLTWRAIDQGVFSTGKGPAYEPWNIHNDTLKSTPLALVKDAILASNPHNTQPWLFKVTDSYIEIYADESRNLGSIDPFRREMFIGLGCAIENLMLSATTHGYQAQLHYKPTILEPYCIARINLKQGERYESPLYNFIPLRHTHRGKYDTSRSIPKTVFTEIESLIIDEKKVRISWFSSTEDIQKIGDCIVRATEAIIADEEMSIDSNKWFKDNWKEIQEQRDGITLDAQGGSFFIRAVGKILPPLSREKNDQFWLSATKDVQTATASAYGLLSIKDSSDNIQRARAGRAWQRIHLYGTSLGLGMQPLSQINEIADREIEIKAPEQFGKELKNLTGDASWNGIQLFRMGYPVKETHLSPRRPLNDVVL